MIFWLFFALLRLITIVLLTIVSGDTSLECRLYFSASKLNCSMRDREYILLLIEDYVNFCSLQYV